MEKIDPDTKDIEKLLKRFSIKISERYHPTRGQLANVLTHIRIWKKMIEDDVQNLIILEESNLEDKIKKIIKELPEDYDFLYLFIHPDIDPNTSTNPMFYLENKKHIVKAFPNWGAFAYVISNKGAKKLIESFKILTRPFEEKLYSVLVNLNSYSVKENFLNIQYYKTLNSKPYQELRFFNLLLKSDKKRVKHVNINLVKNIPNLEIFPAIEGKTNELEFYLEGRKINELFLKICRRGQLACFLSHLKIWKKMIQENIDEAVILEDDAKISEDFMENFLEIYYELPKDYNFVYLFLHPKKPRDYDVIMKQSYSDHLNKGYPTYGFVAYVITKEFATEVLNSIQDEIILPIDDYNTWFLERYQKNYFCVKDSLVETNGNLLLLPYFSV